MEVFCWRASPAFPAGPWVTFILCFLSPSGKNICAFGAVRIRKVGVSDGPCTMPDAVYAQEMSVLPSTPPPSCKIRAR